MKPISNPQSSPFQQLAVLAERVKQSGSHLPKEVDEREQWSGVSCKIFSRDYILRLDEVAEVLDKVSITLIPGSASWIKGVVNLRGRLLPVYGLSEYFTNTASNSIVGQVVVVESPSIFCGFAVEKVYGMKKYYQEDFVENTPKSNNFLADYIDYISKDEEHDSSVLNIFALAKILFNANPAVAGNVSAA